MKTDDPQLERANALADVIHAQHQAAYTGLRLGDIIEALEQAPPDAAVVFDFCGFTPDGIDSWRGVYSDLAIGCGERHRHVPVRDFLNVLRDADGKVFTGYKGGDYRMGLETPVWVSNYGDADSTAVVRVTHNRYQAVLHTAMIDT